MKSRDEILEEVRKELFSVRHAFFGLLDRATIKPNVGKMAWPDALTILTLEEWNAAYEGAMAFRDACRRGERPPMPRYSDQPKAGQ